MQKNEPVLIITQDEKLWARTSQLQAYGWPATCAGNLQAGVHWRSRGHQFVVLDAGLPDLPRWSAEVWSTFFQDMKVLVMSAQHSDVEGHEFLGLGASGYTHLHHSAEHIARILVSLQEGAIWMGRSLLQKLLREIDMRLPVAAVSSDWSSRLSIREKEVALLAATGQSNAEIAQALQITDRTVRAHLSAIFEKLGVSDRLQLTLKVHGIKS